MAMKMILKDFSTWLLRLFLLELETLFGVCLTYAIVYCLLEISKFMRHKRNAAKIHHVDDPREPPVIPR